MPLQMASELRFSMGATESLNNNTVDSFISLIRKVAGPMGQQQIVETFK